MLFRSLKHRMWIWYRKSSSRKNLKNRYILSREQNRQGYSFFSLYNWKSQLRWMPQLARLFPQRNRGGVFLHFNLPPKKNLKLSKFRISVGIFCRAPPRGGGRNVSELL